MSPVRQYLNRKRMPAVVIASILAGLLAACESSRRPPASPSLELKSSDECAIRGDGSKLVTFRFAGTEVSQIALRLVRAKAGETEIIAQEIVGSLFDDFDGAVFLLVESGQPFGQADTYLFNVVSSFPTSPLVSRAESNQIAYGLRPGGGQRMNSGPIAPGKEVVLWAGIYWPEGNDSADGEGFEDLDAARQFSREHGAVVMVLTAEMTH